MNLDGRLERLERARRRDTPRTVEEMTDAELEAIIGIDNPTDEQLAEIIRQAKMSDDGQQGEEK